MQQYDYNAYSMSIVDEPHDMPFLAGGYTQADWDILNGSMIDREVFDDIETPNGRSEYISWWTKPYWA